MLPILQSIEDSGLILRNHLIWQYNFAVFTEQKFASSHYHILYVIKDEKEVFFNRIKLLGSVKMENEMTKHEIMK
ncbi:hypothetical protein DSAG12_04640 [Promethearchaeum syntrophicum]|uniref:Uncharacterized protein n=1 Tax=Promethearchaeum syntrophicum TaxID=2594042 RepID=A0AC61ZU65_9ARCH|nr:hypothetical protein [Candidatus Prometheoarchaeum syntrophicum]